MAKKKAAAADALGDAMELDQLEKILGCGPGEDMLERARNMRAELDDAKTCLVELKRELNEKTSALIRAEQQAETLEDKLETRQIEQYEQVDTSPHDNNTEAMLSFTRGLLAGMINGTISIVRVEANA